VTYKNQHGTATVYGLATERAFFVVVRDRAIGSVRNEDATSTIESKIRAGIFGKKNADCKECYARPRLQTRLQIDNVTIQEEAYERHGRYHRGRYFLIAGSPAIRGPVLPVETYKNNYGHVTRRTVRSNWESGFV
jgi:hypothetical protein